MFMLTTGPGMNFAFPDVCQVPTPVGPIPIPFPNVAMSSTSSPVVSNVTIEAMPVVNLNSKAEVSAGDQPGVAGGVVSACMSGPANYIVGCTTIMVGGAPAQRLTSVTGQNAMGETANAPGTCLAPSQTTVLALG